MNWIEKMIAEQCPNGVKKVKLGEVCDFRNGFAFKSTTFKDSGIPVIRITNIVNHSVDLTDAKYIEPSDYKETLEPYTISLGNILVAMSGATTGKIGIYSLKEKAYQNQRVGMFAPNLKKISNKFLYHYLYGQETNMYMLAGGGAQPNLSSIKVMESLEIPLPSLSIQEEIVSVLDKFSELIEKTDEEIALRQKQYEYYREKLLTFEKGEDCKEMSLGEIGKMKRGNGLQKSDFRANGFPCIHYGQIHTSYGLEAKETISFCENSLAKKLKKAKYGDLLIATTSEDVEACCKAVVWLGNEEVAFSGDSFCFSHNQNPKYISYLFCTEQFAKQKRKVATGAKVVRVSGDAMEKFTFLFPSLSRQQEIVETLDKFETLISKLKEERELRQKQYEYYREKLLTF